MDRYQLINVDIFRIEFIIRSARGKKQQPDQTKPISIQINHTVNSNWQTKLDMEKSQNECYKALNLIE